MRNFSNQQGGRPSNGNRGSYGGGNRSGGHSNREHRPGGEHRSGGEHREHRSDRDNRGGGYRGHNPRFDRNEPRHGAHRSHGPSGNRSERHDRHEREDRPRHERTEGQGPRGSSWLEVSARSVEEAIEEAARRFNVSKSDLKTEVVEEGSKGFLGIGSKPAKVRISMNSSAVPAFAEGVLSRLLRGMSLPDKVKVQKDDDGNTVLNIQGPSSGTLIGRHGHTLESLQYLVGKMVQRVTGDEKNILVVDVENYLERQKDKLRELATNLAQKAKETGVEIPMRPMSSKDRRVVHMTLKDHEHVTTESRGEGLRRKVVIVPKVKAPETTPEAAAQAAAAAEAAGNVEPGNVEPPEDKQPSGNTVAPVVTTPVDGPEPGNTIPVEKEIDDNVGNRA